MIADLIEALCLLVFAVGVVVVPALLAGAI